MRRLTAQLLLTVALVAGCAEQSDSTSHSSESGERQVAEPAEQVSLDLSSQHEKFNASWSSGGSLAPASVPLRLVLKSNVVGELSLANATLVLDAFAENSQHRATRAFPLGDRVTTLKQSVENEMTVEAGEFLTELACAYMKGDTLTVKAEITIPSTAATSRHIESKELKIRLFVPEG